MNVNWDPYKARSNYKKHGIHFSDVEPLFYDPYAITIEDTDSKSEHRYVSIGLDAVGRVLVAVYTYVNNDIRLISARKAEKHERRDYEKRI